MWGDGFVTPQLFTAGYIREFRTREVERFPVRPKHRTVRYGSPGMYNSRKVYGAWIPRHSPAQAGILGLCWR